MFLPSVHRRPFRPAAPRCRGGASSLLRVWAHAARHGVRRGSRWLALPPTVGAGSDPQPGFITPLQPSAAVRPAVHG